ncbi:MAG: hypothetical protein KGL12_05300 [Rhodospirillales bacterium]|nr:hypothetical protein [Rhodospirillales bacterium]
MSRTEAMRPRLRDGVVEFPVHHMRGGTSTGLVIDERAAPAARALREELLRHLMGLPLSGTRAGNRQITGLGRGIATSNKVFFAGWEKTAEGPRLSSTLAQLAADKSAIDWSVNCGNMSAALPLFALEAGWLHRPAGGGALNLAIFNTNTGVTTDARMRFAADGLAERAEIPGVDGAFPAVDLFLRDPVGAKTGTLLPTGKVVDVIAGREVSCVDVAVPMVILRAADFGKTGQESPAALEADGAFIAALRETWIAAGLRMGLRNRAGALLSEAEIAASETVPKVCIVGAPAGSGNLTARYFTPQTAHPSMAVSGGCCLGAAALIAGSVAHQVARGLGMPGRDYGEFGIAIENPAGILDAVIEARADADGLAVRKAAYRRSAQLLLAGHVPLYRASPELRAALLGGTEALAAD